MALYGIKEACNCTVKSKATGKPVLYTDYCTATDNVWSASRVYAMSGSTRAIAWDFGKEGTLKLDMEVFDLRALALICGEDDFTTGTTSAFKREVLKVGVGNTVTLSSAPLASSLTIFKTTSLSDTVLGKERILGTPASAPDTYSITGSTVTLNATSDPVDSFVVVYYAYTSGATAKKLTFSATKFPQSVSVVYDSMIRDNSGVDSFVQYYYDNCRPKSDITLTFSATDVTKLSIELDILKSATSNDMATMTIL